MTDEELIERFDKAANFSEEVEIIREFQRAEIKAGRAEAASFQRNFCHKFRATHTLKDMLKSAKKEVVAVLSTFNVRSHPSIMETLEHNEKDRTYIISVRTERPLTEEEEMALPVCPYGIPVLHNAVTPFDFFAPYSIGGLPPHAP